MYLRTENLHKSYSILYAHINIFQLESSSSLHKSHEGNKLFVLHTHTHTHTHLYALAEHTPASNHGHSEPYTSGQVGGRREVNFIHCHQLWYWGKG